VREFRDVVVPVLSAYLVLAGVVLYAARHPAAGRARKQVVWADRLKLIAVTVGGGYVAFLAIVLVFHVWVVGEKGALRSAERTGLFLAATSAVAFLLLSVLEARRREDPDDS
jgi:hypothetical protein